jgi:hypothetical protein
MSVAAGWEGAGIIVVLVTDLVATEAVVGWAVRGTGAERSFRGVCSIGSHTFDKLGHLKTVVWGALAQWLVYALAYSLLAEYDLEFWYTVPCVGAKVFVECM